MLERPLNIFEQSVIAEFQFNVTIFGGVDVKLIILFSKVFETPLTIIVVGNTLKLLLNI